MNAYLGWDGSKRSGLGKSTKEGEAEEEGKRGVELTIDNV